VVSAFSTGSRVLVTGGDGFTGRYLVPRLEQLGHYVIEHSAAACDLRDAESITRFVEATQPDFVIHLAAISFIPHGSAAEIYAVNTVGTVNLLDAIAAVRPKIKKVVLASSSQVYGSSESDALDEASPCRPVSHYACSKLAMEHMAATYGDRLPIITTRPFNYTGPGQPDHFLVPKIVAHYARGASSIELGNVDVIRDFSDVRMVVDAYCRLLEAPCIDTTLNICSGVGRSLRWLLDEAGRLSGRSLRVSVNPAFVRTSDVRQMIGSNRRLVQAIGPLQHSDFSETLRWMLENAGDQVNPPI